MSRPGPGEVCLPPSQPPIPCLRPGRPVTPGVCLNEPRPTEVGPRPPDGGVRSCVGVPTEVMIDV